MEYGVECIVLLIRDLHLHDFDDVRLAQMFMKLFLNDENLNRVNGVSASQNVGLE
jgi:hypothetical protein